MRKAWTAALAAVALAMLWQTLTIRYNFHGNRSGLFFTGARQTLPAELEAGTYRVPHPFGYDAQYYRIMAHDPFLEKGYGRYVDRSRFRYRRILVPLLAWTLAGGNGARIDASYQLVILAFLFCGVFWTTRYAQLDKLPAAAGWIILLDPAMLTSIDRMLLDGAITALAAGFLVAERTGNRRLRYVCSMLAALGKETGIVLACAAALDDLRRRNFRHAAISATSAIPALAWFGYVEWRTESSEPINLITLPLVGILRRIFTFRRLGNPALQAAFRAVDLLSILGFAATLWLAWLWMRRDGVNAATLLMGMFLAMALVFGAPGHLLDAYGYARPVSPLLFWVMLRSAGARRWNWLVPPLLVTMSIAIYFLKPFMAIVRGIVGV